MSEAINRLEKSIVAVDKLIDRIEFLESQLRAADDLTDALIVRLEAAEECIDDHRGDCLADQGRKCNCGYQKKLETWRKAAGK